MTGDSKYDAMTGDSECIVGLVAFMIGDVWSVVAFHRMMDMHAH